MFHQPSKSGLGVKITSQGRDQYNLNSLGTRGMQVWNHREQQASHLLKRYFDL